MQENEIQTINDKLEISAEEQFEGALSYINELNGSIINKIPVAELSSMGTVIATMLPVKGGAAATETLYRCVFPKGVTGALAMKDGMNLGAIFKNGSIVGQARWQAVQVGAQGAEVAAVANPAVLMAAVALVAITFKLDKIEKKQEEILGVLERDKKSQLLADAEILKEYLQDYKYYLDNEATLTVNLNQVKNIKRNAHKDIRSYSEQIEKLLEPSNPIIGTFSASSDVKKILDRFAHYKLAIYVVALSSYLEVMLSKNFQEEYLQKVDEELRTIELEYRTLYTKCYNVVERLKESAIEKHLGVGLSKASKATGKVIEKIPVISKGLVDEALIAAGEGLEKNIKEDITKTMEFLVSNKDSGVLPVVNYIEMLNEMANKPLELVCDSNVVYFVRPKELARAE